MKEVNSKKELKRFIKFPFELYKNNPYYVTPLIEFEMSTLEDFRLQTRQWLEENCPPSMRTAMVQDEIVWGGRNAEFLLSLTDSLKGLPGVYALAGDTDGIDGSEDNAGALMTPDAYARAARLGLNARDELDNNDGYGYFAALDALIVSGPTRTNVNDFRAILILEEPAQ